MTNERARVGRRAFLALGAGAIGGCVQGGMPGEGGTEQQTATPTESSPPTADGGTETERTRTESTTMNRSGDDSATTVRGDVGIGIDSEKSEPQTTATIGDADPFDGETDTITVWNNADTARPITISVKETDASGEPLFRETYPFEPDAYVVIGVSNPGEYTVSIGVADGEPTDTGFETDDCNIQSLAITVMPNRSVQGTGWSTMMKCGMI